MATQNNAHRCGGALLLLVRVVGYPGAAASGPFSGEFMFRWLISFLKRLLHRLAPIPVHPIDRKLGINTSGTISAHRLASGNGLLDHHNIGYAGSQPSVVHKALAAIWDASLCNTFIDLGCGKGRALAVAGELPFNRMIGIELSNDLANIAQRNVAILKERHTPIAASDIDILVGDASAPDLKGCGSTVIYLYNSFGEPIVRRLLAHLEAYVEANSDQKLWFVYYNPVWTNVIEESNAFDRYFADRIAFSAEEAAAHPFDNRSDSVVIWQSRSGEMFEPRPGHDRKVIVTIPDRGADVQ